MKKKKHDGDCTIYACMCNGSPEDGICTCGYGRQILYEEGSYREMYSNELLETLKEKYKHRHKKKDKEIFDDLMKKLEEDYREEKKESK